MGLGANLAARDGNAMMEKIVQKQMLSESLSERMLRLLGRNYWDEEAISSNSF